MGANKSTEAILNLMQTEEGISQKFVLDDRYSSYFNVWEQAYDLLTRFSKETSLHKTYGGLAGWMSEAHSSLRTSFTCNTSGYHEDAATLIRRVHESTTKMIAAKIDNSQYGRILLSTDVRKQEHVIGVDWYTLYRVGAAFAHSDQIQAIEITKAIIEGNEYAVPYGPQFNRRRFQWAANVSIFWMYILINSAPRVFHKQINQSWIDDQQKVADLTLDYLSNLPHSMLLDHARQLDDDVLDKIGSLEALAEI